VTDCGNRSQGRPAALPDSTRFRRDKAVASNLLLGDDWATWLRIYDGSGALPGRRRPDRPRPRHPLRL